MGYSVHFTWQWTIDTFPGVRALDGLRLLTRFLGFEPRPRFIAPGRYGLCLTPRAGCRFAPPTADEAVTELAAWALHLLPDYPGNRWEIAVPGHEKRVHFSRALPRAA